MPPSQTKKTDWMPKTDVYNRIDIIIYQKRWQN